MASTTAPGGDHYGLGSPAMLEKIDKLFACGVGELVDLPQIVVVGDQSCGKSSVLEAIVQKAFPKDSGLCTRFATQIVFRRSKQSNIHVSIIPDRTASPEHSSRLKAWGKSVKSLDSKVFTDIMREVHDVMGLSKGKQDWGKPTFSSDVLSLQIEGPEQEHLSVIDVPGIFKSTTAGLTTKADIQLVRDMVKGYMENPRSVMLTVIPANVDMATQEILELAAEADPAQDRTLGVFTKPDLVDRGAESRVIDVVDGRSNKTKLGWHIIRNPGQLEMSDSKLNRDSLEEGFFRRVAPWNGINKSKVGITGLRERLKEVLCKLVKREFPKVKSEIRFRLDSCQKKLQDFGPERGGYAEQVAYLTNLATRFQRLASAAMDANHGASALFDTEASLRISPLIRSRMNTFSEEMGRFGELYKFLPSTHNDAGKKDDSSVSSDDDDDEEESNVDNAACESAFSQALTAAGVAFGEAGVSGGSKNLLPFGANGHATGVATESNGVATGRKRKRRSTAQKNGVVFGASGFGQKKAKTASTTQVFETRKYEDVEELQDVLHPQILFPPPKRGEIQGWLSNVFQGNRGFELGTFNSSILSTVFRKQMSKWDHISMGFVSDVIVIVHRFITTALASVCNDDDIFRALLNALFDDLIQHYHKALESAQFLLEIEGSDTPMTLNHYFNDNLQKSRQGKVVTDLKKIAFDLGDGPVVKLSSAVQTHAMGNDDHTILEIHDILKSYYKVSRKRFVDNVCNQAALHFMLHLEKGPLALFSPVFVSKLTPAQLEEIAGEAPGLKRTRAELNKEVTSLTEASKILARA